MVGRHVGLDILKTYDELRNGHSETSDHNKILRVRAYSWQLMHWFIVLDLYGSSTFILVWRRYVCWKMSFDRVVGSSWSIKKNNGSWCLLTSRRAPVTNRLTSYRHNYYSSSDLINSMNTWTADVGSG